MVVRVTAPLVFFVRWRQALFLEEGLGGPRLAAARAHACRDVPRGRGGLRISSAELRDALRHALLRRSAERAGAAAWQEPQLRTRRRTSSTVSAAPAASSTPGIGERWGTGGGLSKLRSAFRLCLSEVAIVVMLMLDATASNWLLQEFSALTKSIMKAFCISVATPPLS